MSAFARLLGAPANILRDCIKIMQLELVSRLLVPLQKPRSEQRGRVVRDLVNANRGLKVNRSINFTGIKMFFTSYFLC